MVEDIISCMIPLCLEVIVDHVVDFFDVGLIGSRGINWSVYFSCARFEHFVQCCAILCTLTTRYNAAPSIAENAETHTSEIFPPPTEKAEGAGLCLTYFTVVNFAVGNLRRLQKKPWKSSQTTPEL